MDINVRCTACGTGFKVKDKFAGKQGPCPKCKAPIRIPTLEEVAKEAAGPVTIHGPDEYGAGPAVAGGKDNKGRVSFKPASHVDAEFKPVAAVLVGACVIALLVISLIVGQMLGESPGTLAMTVWGLLFLIATPVNVAGYWILRDDEKEPYRGLSLYARAFAAGVAYCLLWMVVGYVQWLYPGVLKSGYNWMFVAPPLLGLGALAATLAMDLEGTEGSFHCAMFVLAGLAVRWAAGISLMT